MKRLLIIVCLLSGLSSILHAQNTKMSNLNVALLSEGFRHVGLNVGIDFTLKEWDKRKQKKTKEIIKKRRLLLSPQVGFYQHKQNHTALLTSVELGYLRQRKNRPWSHLWAIGFGAFTQFNSGTTYVVQEDGSIVAQQLASRTYTLPSMSYAVAYDMSSKITCYAKSTLGYKMAFNTFFSIVPLLEVGAKIHFKNR